MNRSRHCFAALLAVVVFASAQPALASGYYNMPTSLPQCLGLGYGPGYHAPLLLSRSYKATIASQRVQRIPAPLPPPQSHGFGTSTWMAPCEAGQYGGGSYGGYGAVDHRGPAIEMAMPASALPMMVVPQQVMASPNRVQQNYGAPSRGPVFPSANAAPKPILLW